MPISRAASFHCLRHDWFPVPVSHCLQGSRLIQNIKGQMKVIGGIGMEVAFIAMLLSAHKLQFPEYPVDF